MFTTPNLTMTKEKCSRTKRTKTRQRPILVLSYTFNLLNYNFTAIAEGAYFYNSNDSTFNKKSYTFMIKIP